MKKKIVSFILIGTVLGLGLSTVLFSPKKAVVESRCYSTSSLPTTIDLNATSASDIRSYYSSLNNLSTSERQGTNLLKNLKTILKNGQKYYSYDSGSAIWQIYEITDRDWDKSPASSTTYGTYNSSTNKITNYTYGTSASNSKNNPYIHALYINRNVTNQTTAWDDHQQTEWGINREHVWPKAEGFEGSGDGGARGDPMHLMAGNGYSNNIHSNYYYGYVDTSSSYTNCGTKYSNQEGNLRGNSKTLGGTTSVFEPQDCDKGDIARAIFYMVARYNYLSNSDSDGIDQNNPNLTLTQSLSDWSSSSYCSSTSETGKMGIMTDLLAWHHADPVDEYEIRRNNLLYTNYTNNRNPFIDFPQWVDFIWGTATYNGTTYQSYSSTPTGYATPSTDTINGYNSGSVTPSKVIQANTVTIKSGATVISGTYEPSSPYKVGDTLDLSSSLVNYQQGSNYENGNNEINWSSSNTSVATITDGIISFIAKGTTTITATAVDAGLNGSTVSNSFTLNLENLISNPGTEDNPYTVAQARAAIDELSTVSDAYTRGIICGVDSFNSTYKSITYWISDDGTETNKLQVYSGKNVGGADFSSKDDLQNGDIVVVKGKLKKYNSTYEYDYNNQIVSRINAGAPSSISASVEKIFNVGDVIKTSDIVVKDNLNNIINDFVFSSNNYQFVYSDANSGGSVTNKTFSNSISYSNLVCSLTVQVQRKAFQSSGTTNDVLDLDFTGQNGNTYSSWSGKQGQNSSAVYAGHNAGSNSSIQLRSTQTSSAYYSGIVSTSSGGPVKQVSVTWNSNTSNGRTLNVYGKDTAYVSPNDLYNDSNKGTLLGTIVMGTSTVLNVSGTYPYVGVCSASGAMYLTDITFTYSFVSDAKNVSNYVMYEDASGQCVSKFNIAKGYFEDLSKAQRTEFMTSNDYVVSTARTRLEAWANSLGKVITLSNGDYVISNSKNSTLNVLNVNNKNVPVYAMIVALAFGSGTIICLFIIKRRRARR